MGYSPELCPINAIASPNIPALLPAHNLEGGRQRLLVTLATVRGPGSSRQLSEPSRQPSPRPLQSPRQPLPVPVNHRQTLGLLLDRPRPARRLPLPSPRPPLLVAPPAGWENRSGTRGSCPRGPGFACLPPASAHAGTARPPQGALQNANRVPAAESLPGNRVQTPPRGARQWPPRCYSGSLSAFPPWTGL